ncbi:hypothetical protein [Zunongwangia atlantica]|uniref:hypothetical protein n=1 Tax=Zunongwangia atlantica TaxID=1502297 RepID=UPI00159434ED|nr:hypothetical protein [Zunongwangia atlantica]
MKTRDALKIIVFGKEQLILGNKYRLKYGRLLLKIPFQVFVFSIKLQGKVVFL